MVTLNSTTSTTIQLTWSSSGSLVDSYEVKWEKDTSGKCPEDVVDIGNATVISTSYTILDLDEDSRYTITVNATNAADSSAVSVPITAITKESGDLIGDITSEKNCNQIMFSPFQLHLPLPLLSIHLTSPTLE